MSTCKSGYTETLHWYSCSSCIKSVLVKSSTTVFAGGQYSASMPEQLTTRPLTSPYEYPKSPAGKNVPLLQLQAGKKVLLQALEAVGVRKK